MNCGGIQCVCTRTYVENKSATHKIGKRIRPGTEHTHAHARTLCMCAGPKTRPEPDVRAQPVAFRPFIFNHVRVPERALVYWQRALTQL